MADGDDKRNDISISVDSGAEALYAMAGVGVWWYVWGFYGFWWGLVYGVGWPVWVGYRLAAYLLAPR